MRIFKREFWFFWGGYSASSTSAHLCLPEILCLGCLAANASNMFISRTMLWDISQWHWMVLNPVMVMQNNIWVSGLSFLFSTIHKSINDHPESLEEERSEHKKSVLWEVASNAFTIDSTTLVTTLTSTSGTVHKTTAMKQEDSDWFSHNHKDIWSWAQNGSLHTLSYKFQLVLFGLWRYWQRFFSFWVLRF